MGMCLRNSNTTAHLLTPWVCSGPCIDHANAYTLSRDIRLPVPYSRNDVNVARARPFLQGSHIHLSLPFLVFSVLSHFRRLPDHPYHLQRVQLDGSSSRSKIQPLRRSICGQSNLTQSPPSRAQMPTGACRWNSPTSLSERTRRFLGGRKPRLCPLLRGQTARRAGHRHHRSRRLVPLRSARTRVPR